RLRLELAVELFSGVASRRLGPRERGRLAAMARQQLDQTALRGLVTGLERDQPLGGRDRTVDIALLLAHRDGPREQLRCEVAEARTLLAQPFVEAFDLQIEAVEQVATIEVEGASEVGGIVWL